MIDIESLIPHREPIKIMTEVIALDGDDGTAAAVVNERWPLCDGRAVKSIVLIEAIAQTAAIVEGYKRKMSGKDGVKGWLVGIKSAEFTKESIPINTRITASVHSLYSFEKYGVTQGVVKAGDEVLLTAVLQVMRLNEDV